MEEDSLQHYHLESVKNRVLRLNQYPPIILTYFLIILSCWLLYFLLPILLINDGSRIYFEGSIEELWDWRANFTFIMVNAIIIAVITTFALLTVPIGLFIRIIREEIRIPENSRSALYHALIKLVLFSFVSLLLIFYNYCYATPMLHIHPPQKYIFFSFRLIYFFIATIGAILILTPIIIIGKWRPQVVEQLAEEAKPIVNQYVNTRLLLLKDSVADFTPKNIDDHVVGALYRELPRLQQLLDLKGITVNSPYAILMHCWDQSRQFRSQLKDLLRDYLTEQLLTVDSQSRGIDSNDTTIESAIDELLKKYDTQNGKKVE